MSVIYKNEIHKRMGEAGYNHFEWDNKDQERQMPHVLSYMEMLALNLQICEFWNLK